MRVLSNMFENQIEALGSFQNQLWSSVVGQTRQELDHHAKPLSFHLLTRPHALSRSFIMSKGILPINTVGFGNAEIYASKCADAGSICLRGEPAQEDSHSIELAGCSSFMANGECEARWKLDLTS